MTLGQGLVVAAVLALLAALVWSIRETAAALTAASGALARAEGDLVRELRLRVDALEAELVTAHYLDDETDMGCWWIDEDDGSVHLAPDACPRCLRRAPKRGQE